MTFDVLIKYGEIFACSPLLRTLFFLREICNEGKFSFPIFYNVLVIAGVMRKIYSFRFYQGKIVLKLFVNFPNDLFKILFNFLVGLGGLLCCFGLFFFPLKRFLLG